MKYRLKPTIITLFLLIFFAGPAWADVDEEVIKLQHRWAEVNYQLQDKAQLAAFKSLLGDADKTVETYSDVASSWIWRGIIKSTYAGAKGGLGALSLAKIVPKQILSKP